MLPLCSLNTTVDCPEIVVMGDVGSGKTTFLEAFLGEAFGPCKKGRGTLRPIYFNLINNPSNEFPKMTLKRDTFLDDEQYSRDLEIKSSQLEQMVEERNVLTSVPIYVHIEYRYCWNLTFIDTPGLPALDEEEEGSPYDLDAIDKIVMDLISQPHRIIIAVEACSIEGGYEITEVVKAVDPGLERTLFACGNFSSALSEAITEGGVTVLNRYMSGAPRSGTTFWLSYPTGRLRAKYDSGDLLREKTLQLHEADLKQLDELRYDRRFAPQIGLESLRLFLIELTWRRYQDAMPSVLRKLQSLRNKSSHDLRHVQDQLTNLDTHKLRAAASSYVMSFLQTVGSLLEGTLAGGPVLNGMTMEEEHQHEKAGPWIDSSYQIIEVDAEHLEIANADGKLYGGQQFARLLSEFKAVSFQLELGELSESEVATSAGPSLVNGVSNLAWVASDLAQKRAQLSLLPLVEHLLKRATFVLTRLADVAQSMLKHQLQDEHSKTQFNGGGLNAVLASRSIAVEEFPFFTRAVTELFEDFVNETAASCRQKCMDEFYCTRIIYWEQDRARDLPDISQASLAESQQAVQRYATDVYDDIRDRVVENVLLKCHNFLLVPMQTELWGELQGRISVFTDSVIQELFEIPATREHLKDKETQLRETLSSLQEQESLFSRASNAFSHPPAK